MTGSADHPTECFRRNREVLVVTAASDRTISGSFRIEATGFLASSPEIERPSDPRLRPVHRVPQLSPSTLARDAVRVSGARLCCLATLLFSRG